MVPRDRPWVRLRATGSVALAGLARRWGADIRINLVAETQEGKLWVIQAKCYDPESQLPTSIATS